MTDIRHRVRPNAPPANAIDCFSKTTLARPAGYNLAPETRPNFLGKIVRVSAQGEYEAWVWAGQAYRPLGRFPHAGAAQEGLTEAKVKLAHSRTKHSA